MIYLFADHHNIDPGAIGYAQIADMYAGLIKYFG